MMPYPPATSPNNLLALRLMQIGEYNLLRDRHPLLRRMSTLTLGRIGSAADRAVDALIALSDSSDRKVRPSAATRRLT